ncbi:MAG: FAD-binding oxidoreductase [Gammaproteobacteria bacterium]|nr:MAG: FAD-binding oxidoreductase [Gammaproteobacteria bacterium]
MPDDIVSRLRQLLGDHAVLSGAAVRERRPAWQTNQPCRARAMLLPSTPAEVADILRLCNAAGQSLVPFGGLTNLVQSCATTAADLALSLERLDTIEEVDRTAHTMTAQAGVTMRQAQEAADAAGLFFPVDIGARDSCMLGGNVATNAGGTRVIRYGMMRDSVLGLEAVLADGTLISSMNRFIKNNSGFDLKHLFIGSEGTLGVITRLVLRLRVKPTTHNVGLVACADFAAVVAVLNRARELLGATLCGFEVMWDSFYAKATRPLGRHTSPFSACYPFYAIIESMGTSPGADEDAFAEALGTMLHDSLIVDAVIAKSDRERQEIWAIRGEVEWLVRDAFNYDVSLRSADVGAYVDEVAARLGRDLPDAFLAAFGHLGDNNIHLSVLVEGSQETCRERVDAHVYEALLPYRGAISAEHGIGLEKRHYLPICRSAQEIALMQTLKRSLDPNNILNPGKVIDGEAGAA